MIVAFALCVPFALSICDAGSRAFAQSANIPEYCLDLDGRGGHVDFGVDAADLGIAGNHEKTVEIWVHLRSFQNNAGIFSLGRTGSGLQDFSLRVLDGGVNRFRGQFWGKDIDFSYDAHGKWVHFAVTHDGSTQRIYADGQLVGEQDADLDTSDRENLKVGFWSYADRSTLDGKVHELRLWNVARSEEEIQNNMHKTLDDPEQEDGLVGYWPLNEGEGDRARDLSANRNHGELIEGAGWTLFQAFAVNLEESFLNTDDFDTLRLGPVEMHDPQGAVSYQWYRDYTPIEGATEAHLDIENVTEEDQGVYYVTVSDERDVDPIASRQVYLGTPDWPMWQYDAARGGDTPLQLDEQLFLQWVREFPEPRRAWRFQWDDRGKLDFDVSFSPVVMGERIFVPSSVTDSVSAYSIDDGRKLWRFIANGPVRLAPAVWQDKVFFTSDDGYIYCVNAVNGELNWKFRGSPGDGYLLGNERIISFWPARGGTVIRNGVVYFTAGVWPLHGIFIYALDAENGEVIWVNDTTSSAHVALPHGGAYGFGGLVPQGYLAASRDTLVVSGGRGAPAFFCLATGQLESINPRAGHKGGGGYAVHAVDGGGVGKIDNEMINNRLQTIEDQIDGRVFCSLAARGRLFVTTECGKLYCFGPLRNDEATEYAYRPQTLRTPREQWNSVAGNLLEGLGEKEGYALILGTGSGDLARAMLQRSKMHVVIVENDPETVRNLRHELIEAGMYGERAAVIQSTPASFAVQPYLFSIVASEDAVAAGIGSDPAVLSRILDRLRPYSSLGYFRNVDAGHAEIEKALTDSAVDQVSIRLMDNLLLARRAGPLHGAGEWTHQLHDPGNTMLSHDWRVRLPLGMLWYGGPSNHDILPRHAGGPRPQVAGGRIVYLGVETIGARCVYTGRQIWRRELPEIGHPFTNLELEQRWQEGEEVYMSNTPGATYIGSPLVTLADAIYLRYRGEILHIDPANGQTITAFKAPGRPVSEIYDDPDAPDWGHISVTGDFLITTGEPHIFEDHDLGKSSYSGTSSGMIAVFDRHSGTPLWEIRSKTGFRHNAIVSDGETLFVIDGLSDNAIEHLQRRGASPEEESILSAYDLRTGRQRWQISSDVFGTFLLHSKKHGILLEGGNRDMRFRDRWIFHEDEPRRVVARNDVDGSVIWESDDFLLPGALHGDMLIPGRPGNAVSILTGEVWQREQALTGNRDDWTYGRTYGCNTLNASVNMLLFRSGYAGFYDLANDSGTGNFSGFRSGCTPNMIAADGVLSALDYTRTCTCSYGNQTSLAMIHMPDDPHIEFWTRGESSRPDPRGYGINLGAPGRRVDVNGSGKVWHEHSGSLRRHASAIKETNGSIPWVLASAQGGSDSRDIRIDDLVEGSYSIRVHFAELDPEVKPGDRVFTVLANGEEVIRDLDVAAESGGAFRGLVREFTIEASHRITIHLQQATDSKHEPIINGIELELL